MATRVLLVEDEPLLSSLYTLMLTRYGYEVLIALNTDQAEEHLLHRRPHVVLLDLLIPSQSHDAHALNVHEPSGFSILRLVKGSTSLAETRVIVLSNLDSDENFRSAELLGADGYVVKANIDPHELPTKIEVTLHQPANKPASAL